MSNKVTGIVCEIGETQTFGAKGFQKRTIVLEQDKGSFTNYVPVEFTRDGCAEADELSVGDEVAIAFRLNGRKWQKDEASEVRYFLNAEALSFDVIAKADGSTVATGADDGEAPF